MREGAAIKKEAAAGEIPGRMEERTFNGFRNIVYERSGISLGPNKEALVSSRIAKRMRALGIARHEDYLAYVENDEGDELVHLIDAISTNVTSFYREPDHFDFLRKRFLEWMHAGQRRFRLWCAASSTGEEPYTIAITLHDAMAGQPLDVKILATDISTRVLGHCVQGIYPKEKTANVPPVLRDTYFEPVLVEGERMHSVSQDLRQMIAFRRLNLAKPPFPMRGPLDVVFCRNVMIYFDNATRTRLLREIYRLLKPGGFLIVGHAESLTGMVSDFKSVQPSVYIKQ